jgi:ribosomal protein S13
VSTKPNERVANLALRAKIAIIKYDQGYVSFEEVGQMVADVVVEAVQTAAKQSSGEITENRFEKVKNVVKNVVKDVVKDVVKNVAKQDLDGKEELDGAEKDAIVIMASSQYSYSHTNINSIEKYQ